MIEDALADYADAQFWVELGLTSLSAAAFAIGSLASGGLAAVLLGGSLAVSGGMAATKVAEWDALRSAKGSAVSADTEVVDPGTVDTAALEAAMAVAQTVLDAAHIAVKLAKPVAGIAIDYGGVQKLPPVDSPEYATVLKNATALVDEEAARMDAIAAANAAARN